MSNNATNNYLANLQGCNATIAIYLANGIKLIGVIEDFDDESIIFNNDQLIIRHNITTIQPA